MKAKPALTARQERRELVACVADYGWACDRRGFSDGFRCGKPEEGALFPESLEKSRQADRHYNKVCDAITAYGRACRTEGATRRKR